MRCFYFNVLNGHVYFNYQGIIYCGSVWQFNRHLSRERMIRASAVVESGFTLDEVPNKTAFPDGALTKQRAIYLATYARLQQQQKEDQS